MGRRKKATKSDDPSKDWEVTTELQINGRYVKKGTELKISGERGRFRFLQHVKTQGAEWIDVWGGPKQKEQTRSFYLDRVVRVHSKNKTDAALAEVYKDKKKAVKEEQNGESE
jgi:hypothetical protein